MLNHEVLFFEPAMISQLEPVAFFRDRILPASQAKLSVYDLGIVLGATITDMARTYRHIPFRLEDHLIRFYESCKYARIHPSLSREQTQEISEQIITHNVQMLQPNEDLGIIYFVTPGENAVYAGAASTVHLCPTFCIHTFELPFSTWAHFLRDGAHVVTPAIRHVPPQCVDPKIKCRSRMHWWLADQETHLVDEKAVTLLLDLDGNATETSGSNFIIAKRGRIQSPTARNILRGISLRNVFTLCSELEIPFDERDFQVHDIVNADEAFLTSTPYGIVPVTSINRIPIGDGRPGPLFSRLAKAWSQQVGLDICQQILGG